MVDLARGVMAVPTFSGTTPVGYLGRYPAYFLSDQSRLQLHVGIAIDVYRPARRGMLHTIYFMGTRIKCSWELAVRLNTES